MHVPVRDNDLQGNDGRGRLVYLPGSPARAARIAEQFYDCVRRPSERGHDLYLGRLPTEDGYVDVATVSTGMGGASAEIIISELLSHDARFLIRVGTAGSLQPQRIRVPSTVIALAAVRDDGASLDYAPIEFPAIASFELSAALIQAASERASEEPVFSGIVHTKRTLYAREFQRGPLARSHREHVRVLQSLNVLASDMETATLFVMARVHSARSPDAGRTETEAASALAIVGDDVPFHEDSALVARAVDHAIQVALRGGALRLRKLLCAPEY